jgi:hypothetical protein
LSDVPILGQRGDDNIGDVVGIDERLIDISKMRSTACIVELREARSILRRRDAKVTSEVWNGIKEKIPHLTRVLFDRSSHLPRLEESARFDEQVIRWLDTGR